MMKYLMLMLLFVTQLFSVGLYDKKYDQILEREYKKYFYNFNHIFNYRIIKAQMWQESRFNPLAKSPVGAFGLMQIMPGTFKDLQKRTGTSGLISDPAYNIFLGMYYNNSLFLQWKSKRTLESRYYLMFASYNAGLGHILNAQRRCNGCAEYSEIIAGLPFITGRHSKETIDYVEYIKKFYRRLQ